MFKSSFLLLLIYDIIIIIIESKSQSKPYQSIYNKPQFYFQEEKKTQISKGQKWFYISNQRPLTHSWYWTKNDLSSSNFYKNALSLHQTDQLSNWACGRSRITNRFGRIVGGQDAVPHSYPWMVSLGRRSLNNLHLCGGVLLTSRHVLTAAHCIQDFEGVSDINIFAGIHYITEKKNPISALSIDIHPQFNQDTFANDIAIITLSSSLPNNDPRIGTICLPPDNIIGKNYPPTKSSAIAIGWGSMSFGGRPSKSLRQVVLPILETTRWPCNIYVTYAYGQICAGKLSGGRDTCQADSGFI